MGIQAIKVWLAAAAQIRDIGVDTAAQWRRTAFDDGACFRHNFPVVLKILATPPVS